MSEVNWKKLESRIGHVERTKEPGRFLLGVLSVLVELLRVYKVLRKSAESLDTMRRSLMTRFDVPRLDSESVGYSGSGWHKSTNYPRNCRNLLTFSGDTISSPELRRRLEEFRELEEASSENCRLFKEYLAAFTALRRKALELNPRNAIQLKIYNLLLSSVPGDKWDGCKRNRNTVFDTLPIEIADRVSEIADPQFPLWILTGRFSRFELEKRGKLQGRKSNKAGEASWKKCHGVELTRQKSIHRSGFGIDDIWYRRTFRVQYELERLGWIQELENAEASRKTQIADSSELCQRKKELEKVLEEQKTELERLTDSFQGYDEEREVLRNLRTDILASERELRGVSSKVVDSGIVITNTTKRMGEIRERIQWRTPVTGKAGELAELLFWIRGSLPNCGFGYAHNMTVSPDNLRHLLRFQKTIQERGIQRDSLISLARYRGTITPCRNGVYQLVIGQCERTESVIVVRGVEVPVLRIPVFCSGSVQWEYVLQRTGIAAVDSVLSFLDSYHSDDTSESVSEIVRILASRLETAVRRAELEEERNLSAEERKKKERRTIAAYAEKLRKLPVLSLEDSFRVGNCQAGTSQFCRQFGITSDSISGFELVRVWKRKNWIVNHLFLRVIDSVSARIVSGVAE